jgi:hypothetical protein
MSGDFANKAINGEKSKMKSRILASLLTVTCFGLLTTSDLRAQNLNSQIDTFEAPGAGTGVGQGTGCFGCTFAINQSGAIVGTYLDANNVFHGFVRSPDGRFTTFEAPGADTTANDFNGTWAQGISDLGEITGYYDDSMGVAHGYVRSPAGAFRTFDSPDGENGTVPLFINLEGAVVGYALDSNLLFHGFLRSPDGTIADFVGPDSCTTGISAACYGSETTYVDLLGASVGNFQDSSGNFVGHGMIRGPWGALVTFDVPGAGTGIYQGTGCPGCNFGVNSWGVIAGTYTDENNVHHGFVRNPNGRFTTFDASGAGTAAYQGTGCFSDCPVSLNDFGVVTGSYLDGNGVQHGYRRSAEGSFVTADPPGSILTLPASINNLGVIAGYYLDENAVWHGFVVGSW